VPSNTNSEICSFGCGLAAHNEAGDSSGHLRGRIAAREELANCAVSGRYPGQPSPSRPMNRLAVASLVMALMPVIPVLAVFTRLIAHGQIQERGERGAAVATAGILIGGFVCLLFAFYALRR
jgi:hypothetical protein